MQFSTCSLVFPCTSSTTLLPILPSLRPFPGGGLCLCRRTTSPASASSPARSWTSWRAGRKNRFRRAFPPLYVVGGADVVESVRGGGEPDEEDEEGAVRGGEGSEFVEVGYISSAHGLRGEVRVKPSTDFPELRFGKPGRRWLRTHVSGEEEVREVELMGGRSHPGQKTWILSFSGVDTVDKAKQIVGSTMLVKEGDRPKLDEGEFYTPDLFGMKVILKETGRQVGTVVNVVNYGFSDLLQVMLNTAKESFDGEGPSESKGGSSGPLVWVPFVEAIVPEVDMDNREMHITPPKGLLELNIRSDTRSKKERRQMEWKQRKKLQQRVTSAKKKLAEIGQEHVLRGFSYGVKNQRRLLADQIGDINLRLFQHAMGSINKCFKRNTYTELLHAKSITSMENGLRISHECYNTFSLKEINEDHYALQAKGLHLISECKVAIVLMLDSKTWESVSSLSEEATSPVLQLKNVLSDYNRYVEVKECGASLPLIILCPVHEMQLCREFLSDHDYFGFDNKKVWLLEEEKLPVVNIIPDDQNKYKILLWSPWEIIQSPVGPGGIFSSLSSHKIVDSLNEMRVEYVQVCTLGERCALAHPLFLGLVSSREVNVGIKIFADQHKDDEIDMIFAMKYLSMATKQVDKLQFYAVPEKNKHVELVDHEWVDTEPSEPNSYRLYCPIYDLLNSCPDDISILSIVD